VAAAMRRFPHDLELQSKSIALFRAVQLQPQLFLAPENQIQAGDRWTTTGEASTPSTPPASCHHRRRCSASMHSKPGLNAAPAALHPPPEQRRTPVIVAAVMGAILASAAAAYVFGSFSKCHSGVTIMALSLISDWCAWCTVIILLCLILIRACTRTWRGCQFLCIPGKG